MKPLFDLDKHPEDALPLGFALFLAMPFLLLVAFFIGVPLMIAQEIATTLGRPIKWLPPAPPRVIFDPKHPFRWR